MSGDVYRCLSEMDRDYIVGLRRELHMYPEVGFDLPKTLAIVRRELDQTGIPYTERYGKSSIVADMGDRQAGFTIGVRADMDALPINETNDVPYKSRHPGMMHACGHDAHTAMLLGTARALKSVESDLRCRVKLIFQACEEGEQSGARLMVEDGVMDDVDIILGLHVENSLDSGRIGICPGPSMAASRPVILEFFGQSAHATLPHSGRDALAMAVKTYNDIQLVLSREVDPFEKCVCSVGALNAGSTTNVIPDYAKMQISVRTYNSGLDRFLFERISTIAANASKEMGGTVKITSDVKAYPVTNDPVLSQKLLESAAKVVGVENTGTFPIKMSSEDFSFYLSKKPGVFFRLGTRNKAKNCTTLPHNSSFSIDEDSLPIGSKTCVQFVLDNMRAYRPAPLDLKAPEPEYGGGEKREESIHLSSGGSVHIGHASGLHQRRRPAGDERRSS